MNSSYLLVVALLSDLNWKDSAKIVITMNIFPIQILGCMVQVSGTKFIW